MRWRDEGRQRSLTFDTRPAAEDFDRALRQTRTQGRQAQRAREALERAR